MSPGSWGERECLCGCRPDLKNAGGVFFQCPNCGQTSWPAVSPGVAKASEVWNRRLERAEDEIARNARR